MADVLDVLIVGGGAAGYTAGIFVARDRCRALLLEKFSSGGQVLNCEHITNFPGFPQGVAGYTLGPLLQEQATAAGLPIAMNEVTGVRRDGDLLRVETDGDTHLTRDADRGERLALHHARRPRRGGVRRARPLALRVVRRLLLHGEARDRGGRAATRRWTRRSISPSTPPR